MAEQLNSGVSHLLKKNKVVILNGHGRLLGEGRIGVEVGGAQVKEVRAKHIILAAGARARDLPTMEADGKQIWNYRHALLADVIPKKLLVVGSGAIGMEFASFFNTLGSEVIVVEVLDRILPIEDEEISSMAREAFENQGMRILTDVQVQKLEKTKVGISATLKMADGKAKSIIVDRVIMADGIVGNVEELGLENT